jgi:predicted HTH domain antitoxin
MFKIKKIATVADAVNQFQTDIDNLLAAAQHSHVALRQLADILEQRAENLRRQFAVTAPMR